MNEEEFYAWVAEIQLSDAATFPAIKAKVEALCKIYSNYAYELHEVIDERDSQLHPGFTFFRVNGEQFQKTSLELLAYNIPISRIIEENSIKDIQEIEDREFILHVEQTGVQSVEGGDRSGGVHPGSHRYPK